MKTVLWLLALESVALAGALIVALDLREHGRVAPLGGVNEWGYRGPVAHRRQPDEVRAVIVGGTRAFAWGQDASALVTGIRRIVMLTTDRSGARVRPVVVINLGRLGGLPDSYPETLAHYAYLGPDYVCLYDDLGVAGGSPTSGTDGTSGVFRVTGYAPALPLVMREKGMAWRFGDVPSGYLPAALRAEPRGPFLRRVAGAAIERVGGALDVIDRRIADAIGRGEMAGVPADPTHYADSMIAAIIAAHHAARGVVAVLSPAETAGQIANRRALDETLRSIGDAPWLRIVDLSEQRRLVTDDMMRIDGWNYSSAGIALVADTIARALVSLLPQS